MHLFVSKWSHCDTLNSYWIRSPGEFTRKGSSFFRLATCTRERLQRIQFASDPRKSSASWIATMTSCREPCSDGSILWVLKNPHRSEDCFRRGRNNRPPYAGSGTERDADAFAIMTLNPRLDSRTIFSNTAEPAPDTTTVRRALNWIAHWQRTRERVWLRDGRSCVRCKAQVSLEKCHVDHVQSGKLGTNHMRNLRTLCRRCHVLRADRRHRGMIAGVLRDGIIPPNWRELVWDG